MDQERDIDSWLSTVSALCDVKKADMAWSEPIPDESEDFEQIVLSSFQNFCEFPISHLSIDIILEAKLIQRSEYFVKRAESIIKNSLNNYDLVNNDDMNKTAELALLSLALQSYPSLIKDIPKNVPILMTVWCLSQSVNADVNIVVKFWQKHLFHPPPISNYTDCHAVLLLLQMCLSKLEPTNKSVFTSDEFEVVFCLAYCSKRSNVKALAASLIPCMSDLIIQSSAAHLLFRRMLPYCAMENKEGQKMAFTIIEEILSHHIKFLSCISTWISLHRMYYFLI